MASRLVEKALAHPVGIKRKLKTEATLDEEIELLKFWLGRKLTGYQVAAALNLKSRHNIHANMATMIRRAYDAGRVKIE